MLLCKYALLLTLTIITEINNENYADLQRKIHDSGLKGYRNWYLNVLDLVHFLENTQPTSFARCVLNVYSLARKLLDFQPIDTYIPPKIFDSPNARITFGKKIKHSSLQLTPKDQERCKYALETLGGQSESLTQENVSKLELGLIDALCLHQDKLKKIFIYYNHEKACFEIGVTSLKPLEWRTNPTEQGVSATLYENSEQKQIHHSIICYEHSDRLGLFKEREGTFRHVNHELVPGREYSIHGLDIKFRLNL